ncbi:MAG TPA: universal stress protein, partial [Ohtaekwangia sp.]|uniref:universal stress protein n=1 Tax=Ohtaekwangia sp. TaxID=2066019 RepID=UPI002F93D3C9
MKKILCPTDFSDAAHTAIAYAAKLAQAINGDLTLLHVESMYDFTPAELIAGKQITVAPIVDQLEAQCREVTKSFRISCYAIVEPTFKRLSAIIQEKSTHYDLIVMGTDGADDLYQFFNGSNAYNAMVESRIPMLIVPNGYIYNELKSIVLAFDYLRKGYMPVNVMAPFIRTLKSSLTILQVQEESYSIKEEEELKDTQEILKTIYGNSLPFSFDAIHAADIAPALNSYMLRHQADALILCSEHRGFIARLFHKSVIKNIAAICQYPVMIFHT